jgi:transposase
MKSYEEAMEILAAFDLTRSYRAAAALCGCDHHTVAHHVSMRDVGHVPGECPERDRVVDPFMEKVEEWVDRSRGKVRADVVHRKLVALGYQGSERTTRRAVAEVKRAWGKDNRRIYRPWIPEPGMWLQFDFGDGPRVHDRRTYLFCAWLAWCRYRVVVPVWDRTIATVISCIDRMLREFGGAPTYALTDNERTITTEHVCGIAVRNPDIVRAANHYGLTIHTCVVADPESKGGVEATVRIAKADLVPTEANLRATYGSFSELDDACVEFMDDANSRPHRITRRAPSEMLKEERVHLHAIPTHPFTVAFGQTRRVTFSSTISFGGVIYSVPHQLCGDEVWARVCGDELVVVHVDPNTGPKEVARHELSTPGNPQINDDHYPNRPWGALNRRPHPSRAEERAFVAIGPGAQQWLIEAAASGASRVRVKMADAVALAKLYGTERVDRALGIAAISARFGEGDLASILEHAADADTLAASDDYSLQPGTDAWKRLT